MMEGLVFGWSGARSICPIFPFVSNGREMMLIQRTVL